ncbi:hypothetical protein [Paraburkholderia fungorum]|uniref:hypothetical protein n=1 Tax=Paraburkholderia fungorum TaxID=134537 RepID=UPI00402B51B3
MPKDLRERRADLLNGHAHAAVLNLPVKLQLLFDSHRDVNRNRKRKSLKAMMSRCINTDDVAVQIEERRT